MYKVQITAISPCAIQDPIPIEGMLSVSIEAGETKEVVMLPSQYERIAPSLMSMQTNGALTFYVVGKEDSVTTGDINLYVDGTLGSDTTGNGTSAAPFKTIPAAYERVPKNISHAVHITIADGTYTDFPTLVENNCGHTGQLSFEGALALSDETEYTVDSFDYGGSDGYTYGDINVPTATWTPAALKGKFVLMTSGDSIGKTYGIITNTETAIRISSFFYDITAADKFNIVEPSVVISSTAKIGFNVPTYQTAGHLQGIYSRLGLAGINFSAAAEIDFKNTSAHLSSVIFQYFCAFASEFNYVGMLDKVKAFTNVNFRDEYAAFFHVHDMCRIGLCNFFNCICGYLIMNWFGLSTISCCASPGIWSRVIDTESYYCYLDDRDQSDGFYCFTCHGGMHTLDLMHFEGSRVGAAMRVKDSACVSMFHSTCTSANIAGFGALVGHECRIAAHGVDITGVGGAIKFENNAAAVAWPAAGTRVADDDGSSAVMGY